MPRESEAWHRSGSRVASVPAGTKEEAGAMNVLSLFSGIGGLELGLERAGMTVVGQVESDEFCRRVLAKHWPGVPRHADVRTAAEWWLSQERATVHVVCGGFPCQPISQAGRRRAQADERWLWPAMANVIRRIRPWYAVVENVADLAARGMGDVLGDLAALGYDAEWQCVPAAAVGAKHRRERILLVAYPHGETRGLETWNANGRSSIEAVQPGQTESRRCGPLMANGDGERLEGGRLPEGPERAALSDADGSGPRIYRRPPRPGGEWLTEPDVGRVADGVPCRVDRLRALGNAVVPQVAEYVGRLIMDYESGRAA